MTARYQTGSLRQERRKKQGDVWVFRFYETRALDGRRVEHTHVIGSLHEYPTKSAARKQIAELHLLEQINGQLNFGTKPKTVNNLTGHYSIKELGADQSGSPRHKVYGTIIAYKRIISKYIEPRWGNRIALGIKPPEFRKWLVDLHKSGLSLSTCARIKTLVYLIYRSCQEDDVIPRGSKYNPIGYVRWSSKSTYKPKTVKPEQVLALYRQLKEPESTLVMLIALTALRISEALALKWEDIDWDGQVISINRSWTYGRIGPPKTETSEGTVPLDPILASILVSWHQETCYASPTDWVFPGHRGRNPRTAEMLRQDHLRPAAIRAGILQPDDKTKWGFHSLRHSLASWMVNQKEDIKTVQDLLRHADIKTTLGIYSHSDKESRLAAQGRYSRTIFPQMSDRVQ